MDGISRHNGFMKVPGSSPISWGKSARDMPCPLTLILGCAGCFTDKVCGMPRISRLRWEESENCRHCEEATDGYDERIALRVRAAESSGAFEIENAIARLSSETTGCSNLRNVAAIFGGAIASSRDYPK